MDGEQILPIIYTDNYITLMPNESKTVNISWQLRDSRGQQPLIEVSSLVDGK